jgi:uncharacterized membrane protein|tara:strand:+ start:1618 stop:2037 length:420 start_codon:yes stop_codon:yes gene_type:complete
MELWMKYALVAAVFIAIRDVFSSKIARKYNYIDYIVHANILVFLGTMVYVLFSKKKIKIIDNYSDLFTIILRLFIVYLIVEPCIYNSFKNTNNPSKASTVINLNIVVLFLITIVFLNKKIDFKQFMGIVLILGGFFCIR